MGDYGYVTLITRGRHHQDLAAGAQRFRSRASDEITTPYYYSVELDAGASRRIRTEITATDHCGYLRFTFPATPRQASWSRPLARTRPGFVHIDAAAHEIVGYNPDRMDAHLSNLVLPPNFKGYFVVKFSAGGSARTVCIWAATCTAEWAPRKARTPAATSRFDTSKRRDRRSEGRHVLYQHRAGPQESAPGDSGVEFRRACEPHLQWTWNQKLAAVAIEGASEDQRRIFYTGALPRAALSEAVLRARPLLQRFR